MAIVTLTEKGQLPFDEQLMAHLGVKAGEKIVVRKMDDGSLRVEPVKASSDLMALAGALAAKTSVRLSDDELDDAIRQSYTNRGDA